MPKNKSAVSQVMDEMAAPLEQNLRGPVNRLFSLIEEIRAMEFSPQDDAIIAAKLRKEVVEIHFGDELVFRNFLSPRPRREDQQHRGGKEGKTVQRRVQSSCRDAAQEGFENSQIAE